MITYIVKYDKVSNYGEQRESKSFKLKANSYYQALEKAREFVFKTEDINLDEGHGIENFSVTPLDELQ